MGLDNPIHLAFLLILLLLVFGAKRLPEMGRSLGSGMRGFKDALSGEVLSHRCALSRASCDGAHLGRSPVSRRPGRDRRPRQAVKRPGRRLTWL